MAKMRNNAISDNHFKKHWRRFVTTWFQQPMRKRRRRQNRVEKAKKVAPRPISLLRPVIRCPTQRYNRKFRQGRGFSLAELKVFFFVKSTRIVVSWVYTSLLFISGVWYVKERGSNARNLCWSPEAKQDARAAAEERSSAQAVPRSPHCLPAEGHEAQEGRRYCTIYFDYSI